VDKVNAALEGTDWADKPIADVIRDLAQVPDDKRAAVRNNGGGHCNHTQNRRPDYIEAWWDVVDWGVVAERFSAV
jgi:superoxide dismutase